MNNNQYTLTGKFWDDLRALPKDCECRTHDGPCFVHTQEIVHAINLKILERGGRLAPFAFAKEEMMRLRNLRHELLRHHIITADEWPIEARSIAHPFPSDRSAP